LIIKILYFLPKNNYDFSCLNQIFFLYLFHQLKIMEQDNKREPIFDKLNIYNHRTENEDYETYKERRKIAKMIIKQYLKGTMFYQCYQDITIPWKEGSEEKKQNKKPKTITLRVLPSYTNPNKNAWRTNKKK